MTGKTLALETRMKLKELGKNRDLYWLKGVTRPDHAKRMTGSKNPRAISFEYCGKTYGTIKEFSKEYGISFPTAKKMINSHNK